MLSTILSSLIDVAIQLIVLLPFLWLAKKSYNTREKNILWIAAALFLLDTILVNYFAGIRLFPSQRCNWVGKFASITWATVFVYVNGLISRNEVGWTTKRQAGSLGFFLSVLVILSVLKLYFYHAYNHPPASVHFETVLFQATMPGIAEEIVFRGILLALLNKVFQTKWSAFGVRFGWGAIISSILFGLVHGFYIDGAWSLHFITIGIIRAAIDGFFLALVKEKTKSLVPAIIIHNVLDVIVCFW